MSEETRTPFSVILDMAKNEIGGHVFECMTANNIPPAFMVSVVKDILLELTQMKVERLSEEFVESHKKKEGEDESGEN